MIKWLRRIISKAANIPGNEGQDAPTYADIWSSQRMPTNRQLIDSFKEIVHTCATMNAQAVSSVELKLYVLTDKSQPKPRISTRKISVEQKQFIQEEKGLSKFTRKAIHMDEVLDHPLLEILEDPNEYMSGSYFLELTSLYLDILGRCFWLMEFKKGILKGTPTSLWLLTPQHVIVKRKGNKIDHYEYTGGKVKENIAPEKVIPFFVPNLKDPYLDGWSPLHAHIETVRLLEKDRALASALYDNRARPDIILSPKDAIGPNEAIRLQKRFMKRMGLGRNGGILVSESGLSVDKLQFSPGELQASTRYAASRNAVANAYGVPLTFLETTSVSRANAEAGHYQHAKLAVLPRIKKICNNINRKICPLFSDRLFVWFENPVPADRKTKSQISMLETKTGISTINEEREARDKPPVSWGEEPWLPNTQSQPSKRQDPKPAPPPQDEPKEDDGKGINNESLLVLLSEYAVRSLGRKVTIVKLCQIGFTTAKAYDLTDGFEASREDPYGACQEKDAEQTKLDWYNTPSSQSGHGRHLPRGTLLEKMLKQIFRAQKKEVFSKVRDMFIGIEKSLVIKSNFDMVDLSNWDRVMQLQAGPHIEVMYRDAYEDTLTRVGVSDIKGTWDVHLVETRQSIENATFSFSHSTNLTTSKEINVAIAELRKEIFEGIVSGGNVVRELTKRVNNVFENAERWRASRIAITESSRAVHGAQIEAAKVSGVVTGTRWLLSGDACEICQGIAMNNPTGVSLGDNYTIIGQHPEYAAVPYPPAHPYCMCTITEILASVKNLGKDFNG